MNVNSFNNQFSKAENHQNANPLKECYDLIACILNARIENEGLAEYRRILNSEFLEFASGVDSLQEKEIALLALQEIKKELQLVASYPSLFQKNMVAVGGGFIKVIRVVTDKSLKNTLRTPNPFCGSLTASMGRFRAMI